MSANVQHVVNAPHDPEIAVFVFARAVAGEVHAGDLRPVILDVAVGIAIHGAQHAGPRPLEDKESAATIRYRLAIHSDDFGYDSGEWLRRRARLRRDGAGNRREHHVSGFGLPPRVDDRTTVATDGFAVPHPRFRVDRLA